MKRKDPRRRRQARRSPAELFVAALGLALLVFVVLIVLSPGSCRNIDIFGVPQPTATPRAR